MAESDMVRSSARPQVAKLALADIGVVLRAGWADFREAPLFGFFFAAVYVLGGLFLLLIGAGLFTWTLTFTLGFPLVAPFLAVGLYEVSRTLEQGQSPGLGAVLSVVWAERTRQIPWAGMIIMLFFLFWSFFAHMLFALFMGPSALIGPPDDLQSYLTGPGLAMTLAELVYGGLSAFVLFALTATSLPMLLDREVDFVTAMLTSLQVVRQNPLVMLVWAAIIAVLTFVAMIPVFLGLFVVLPLLGHASWHLYRRALIF